VRVLIAEDDALFRRALEQLLTSEFEITSVEDGNAAWAVLQQQDHPTLALLDWVMPGMSGPQVCRELRANPHTAEIYAILLTARNSAADVVAGLRAGADDYVTKPFEAEELRARVHIGCRILEMQTSLAAKSSALVNALERERLLQTSLDSVPHRHRWPKPVLGPVPIAPK
jgi:DNA-binding response OmpR family regulator